MSELRYCNCDLRARAWNAATGKCGTCGCRYRRPPPPVDVGPAHFVASAHPAGRRDTDGPQPPAVCRFDDDDSQGDPKA